MPSIARQGAAVLVEGAPCPDPATTPSLLPGVAVAEFLQRHRRCMTGRLLDLGAGNRPFAGWYDELCEPTAVDVTPHPGLTALADAGALPFAEGTFDTVLATEVLEHVDDATAAVHEIARVMAPGASVIVTVPFLYPVHEAPHDHRRFTHHGLCRLLQRQGLVVEDLAAKGGIPALVLNLPLTATVELLRRAGRATRTEESTHAALVALERTMLHRRRRLEQFPRSARRASLGYLALARKPS